MDLAAQEWLNVGIVFRDATENSHFRFISDLSGLRCLYDADAAESARFLLDQVEHALEERLVIPSGWNISLGPEKFVRGASAQSIVDSLFVRMVPLGRHQQGPDRIDREDHPHATINVRKTVRQILNKHLQLSKNAVPEFWRRNPTPIQRDGNDILMDIQIAAAINGASVHGAVASAWYKTRYHRYASLSQSVNAMTTACEAFPNSHNVLYLLKPPASASALSADDHRAIAADIETNEWLLGKHGAKLKTAQTESDLAREILSDLHLTPELH